MATNNKKHKLDNEGQGSASNKKQRSGKVPFRNWKKHTTLFKTTNPIRGVLLTGTHTREGNMIGEMLEIFKFFVDLFYPHLSNLSAIPEAPEESEQTQEKEEAPKDTASSEPAKEPKKQKLFEVINSGCSGMAIISFIPKEIDPVEFTRKILTHILEKAEPRPKLAYIEFTNRVIPIEAACEVSLPSLDTILTAAKPVIDSHFKDKPATKFAIRIEHRNCKGIKTCIDAMAPLVDPSHKVDLAHPDKVIMLQIFKSAAGICVLPDYDKLHKYNIKEIIKIVTTKKTEEGTTSTTTTTSEKKEGEKEKK